MKPIRINPIKYRREMAGMSQRELAKLSGVSLSTVWNLENGFYDGIDAKIAGKIGSVFNLKAGTVINEWTEWNDEKKKP